MKMPASLCLFVLSLVLTILFPSCSGTQSGSDYNMAADTSLTLVIREWSKKINEFPENDENRYKRAMELAKEEQYELALNDLQTAMELSPENPAYLLAKGEVYFANDKTSDALATYEKAVEEYPGNTLAHFRLGRLYFLIKEYDKSETQLTKALRNNRNDVESLWYMGAVQKETGDTTKALAYYQQAIDIKPSHYNSIMQIANLLQAREDTTALKYFNAAIVVDEFSDEAYYGRGLSHQQMGNYKKAVEDYQKTIDLNPTHLFAWYNTASINLIEGHYDRALGQLLNTIKFAPDFAKSYNRIGQIYEIKKEYKLAERYYAKALDLNPEIKLAKEGLNRILDK